MDTSLYLPNKIKVGYQERKDTYTGKLAYVIYYDNKGTLRKEKSWESWRDKKIDPDEFDNVPTEGFVLNKKVGDYSEYYYHRQAYTRVYDPRGFEFEITIQNLLYILENTSSIKGKGLEGEFVYAWDGTELVLVPVDSPDYKDIAKYSNTLKENKSFKGKDMIVGATYLGKGNNELVYLGRYPVYDHVYHIAGQTFSTRRKMENWCEKNGVEYYRKFRKPSQYYDTVESLYEYKIEKSDEEYWFAYKYRYYDGKVEWNITHKKSLSKNIIDILDETCHPEYADLFELMERQVDYSPYDKSKDEFVKYSKEEFKNKIDNWFKNYNSWNDVNLLCKIDDGYQDIYFKKEENKERFYPNSNYSYAKLIFEYETIPNARYWESNIKFKPVSIDELYEITNPHYKNEYLENGKFYRRLY